MITSIRLMAAHPAIRTLTELHSPAKTEERSKMLHPQLPFVQLWHLRELE